MPEVKADKPLVISLSEELTPGLARAVVRNWWPWLKVGSARAAIRSEMFRRRVPLVLLETGADSFEVVQIVRFLRAPWRRTPVVIIEREQESTYEMLFRGEGVACFLSSAEVDPELIEDMVASILIDPGAAKARESVGARPAIPRPPESTVFGAVS
ncbi:hypothetical protein PHYC_00145 [Phycisphaerales bacterium]|nr:hypothetical protein PHYC_00145 [Phycisphaerales bacterium]